MIRRKMCTACAAGMAFGLVSALCLEAHAFYALLAGALLVAAGFSAKPILPVLAVIVIGSKGPLDEQQSP